jgi:hypothetical protein
MPKARIYRPTRTAMQSGCARTRRWTLEFERRAPMTPDPLMGWNTMSNTLTQLHLHFKTRDEAIAYANKHGLDFEVIEPEKSVIPPKSYAENFAFVRRAAFSPKAQSE